MSRAASGARSTRPRKLAALLITVVFVSGSVAAAVPVTATAAFCDESAQTYTSGMTNTAGAVCIDSGAQDDAFMNGAVVAETVLGVLLGMLVGWAVLRRLVGIGAGGEV